ncbi:MAG: glycosyl transferase [Phycisphaeraceae bacterium]|nr:MAG: glycosyl transferase [Phycisphaeraceae bacterium]
MKPDGTWCERAYYLVDDGSTDGSDAIIAELAERDGVRALGGTPNRGKGHALSLGFAAAVEDGCDALIVQDADLEYDPADMDPVLSPILDGRADAVIGTRFLGESHRVLYYWHSIANRVITTFSNMLSNLNLTDIECGYKAFTRDVAARITITESRFGVEPELVAKLAKMRLPADDAKTRPLRIYEVPISYAGRTYAEGKKIGWRDGVAAMWAIAKHNLG